MDIKPLYNLQYGQLPVSVYSSNEELGQAAAKEAAKIIDQAIDAKGVANIIIATGNSQLTFLAALKTTEIDWSKVNIFHMDEYVGIDPNHPASFPVFLQKHLISFIHPLGFFPVQTQTDNLPGVCRDYETLLRKHPADLCALGIGENGHLAFNDPAYADFNDPVWVKVVKLDDVSRQQQVGEGHFASLHDVPTHAVTLTIPALMAATYMLAMVPEARKAAAVYKSLTDPIQVACPATILRQAPHAHLFLDLDSAASILDREGLRSRT
jgi:glucosamine-6-phosphate deaminase